MLFSTFKPNLPLFLPLSPHPLPPLPSGPTLSPRSSPPPPPPHSSPLAPPTPSISIAFPKAAVLNPGLAGVAKRLQLLLCWVGMLVAGDRTVLVGHGKHGSITLMHSACSICLCHIPAASIPLLLTVCFCSIYTGERLLLHKGERVSLLYIERRQTLSL